MSHEQTYRLVLHVTAAEGFRLARLLKSDPELFEKLLRRSEAERAINELVGPEPEPQPVRRNGIEFNSDAEWREHRTAVRQTLSRAWPAASEPATG